MGHSLGTAELFERLPERTRTRLKALVSELAATLGDDLHALLVHGSLVRGGFRDDSSDVDLLLVLKDDAPEKLTSISNALILARAAARIEGMILRLDEIPSSADVFPLLFWDIQQRHVLLHGKDPFEGLAIHDHHIRLRVEQELRESRIRLRRMLVDEGGDARDLVGAMERKVKQLRSPLHALLRLHGKTAQDDLASVYAQAGTLLGVETSVLLQVRERPAAALTSLRQLLDAGVKAADALEGKAG